MMEAVRTSETPVYFNETTRLCIPEGYDFQEYNVTGTGGVEVAGFTVWKLCIVMQPGALMSTT
jgi:hypothetical protein